MTDENRPEAEATPKEIDLLELANATIKEGNLPAAAYWVLLDIARSLRDIAYFPDQLQALLSGLGAKMMSTLVANKESIFAQAYRAGTGVGFAATAPKAVDAPTPEGKQGPLTAEEIEKLTAEVPES
jgi:hypothetical protein